VNAVARSVTAGQLKEKGVAVYELLLQSDKLGPIAVPRLRIGVLLQFDCEQVA